MRSDRLPRFYFHVHDHAGVTTDLDGREFPDLMAAQREAIKGVRSILGYEVSKGLIDLTGRIEIAAPDGGVLLTIAFADAVSLRTS